MQLRRHGEPVSVGRQSQRNQMTVGLQKVEAASRSCMAVMLVQPKAPLIEGTDAQVNIAGGHPNPAKNSILLGPLGVGRAEVFQEFQQQRCITCLLPSSKRHFLQTVDAHGHIGNVSTVQLVVATLQPALCPAVDITEAFGHVVALGLTETDLCRQDASVYVDRPIRWLHFIYIYVERENPERKTFDTYDNEKC